MNKSAKTKKGFTLYELLAIVVIIGIIIGIIIPAVSTVFSNYKKQSYVKSAQAYISALRNLTSSLIVDLPMEEGTASIVMLNNKVIKLEKGGDNSPFGSKYDKKNSYVAAINIGTTEDPDYKFVIAIKDEKGIGINLTLESDIKKESVVSKTTFKVPTNEITVKGKIYKIQ